VSSDRQSQHLAPSSHFGSAAVFCSIIVTQETFNQSYL
jgi:hypothetical protein